jgi:hypothetical protein
MLTSEYQLSPAFWTQEGIWDSTLFQLERTLALWTTMGTCFPGRDHHNLTSQNRSGDHDLYLYVSKKYSASNDSHAVFDDG